MVSEKDKKKPDEFGDMPNADDFFNDSPSIDMLSSEKIVAGDSGFGVDPVHFGETILDMSSAEMPSADISSPLDIPVPPPIDEIKMPDLPPRIEPKMPPEIEKMPEPETPPYKHMPEQPEIKSRPVHETPDYHREPAAAEQQYKHKDYTKHKRRDTYLCPNCNTVLDYEKKYCNCGWILPGATEFQPHKTHSPKPEVYTHEIRKEEHVEIVDNVNLKIAEDLENMVFDGSGKNVKRRDAKLIITYCFPSNASITIDGREIHVARPVILKPDTTYLIKAESTGYVPFIRKVHLDDGEKCELYITLERDYKEQESQPKQKKQQQTHSQPKADGQPGNKKKGGCGGCITIIIIALAIAYFAGAFDDSPPKKDLIQYKSELKTIAAQKDPKTAINAYTILISKYPYAPEAYFQRGQSYIALGKFWNAINDFNMALSNKAKNVVDVRLYRAYAYMMNGESNNNNYKTAISDLDFIILASPKNDRAYYYRGYCNSRMKNYTQAISDCTAAININPMDYYYHYERGYAYYMTEDIEHALDDFTKAISLNPKYADAYFYRGEIYYEKKNAPHKAILEYTKAIEYNTDKKPSYYYKRGKACFDVANSDKNKKDFFAAAEKDFSDAIAINPKDNNYYFMRGRARLSQENGKEKEAIEDFTQSLNMNRRYYAPYFYRGLAYLNIEEFETAVKDYHSYIRGYPKDHVGLNNLGFAYYNLGNLSSAISYYSRAIDIDNAFILAITNRCIAYQDRKDFYRASRDADRLKELGKPSYYDKMVKDDTYKPKR